MADVLAAFLTRETQTVNKFRRKFINITTHDSGRGTRASTDWGRAEKSTNYAQIGTIICKIEEMVLINMARVHFHSRTGSEFTNFQNKIILNSHVNISRKIFKS